MLSAPMVLALFGLLAVIVVALMYWRAPRYSPSRDFNEAGGLASVQFHEVLTDPKNYTTESPDVRAIHASDGTECDDPYSDETIGGRPSCGHGRLIEVHWR